MAIKVTHVPETGIFRCRKCGALNRVPKNRIDRIPKCGQCKTQLDASNHPQDVDTSELENAIASSPVPILVDLWAPWCSPCKAAAPMMVDIAEERAGQLLVLKLNTDENPDFMQKLGVRGIPTFVLYDNGEELARQTGLLSMREFDEWVVSNAKL